MSVKNLDYQKLILKKLVSEHYTTLKALSSELGLTYKSTRLQVQKLDMFLNDNDLGKIESKQGFGIWLNSDSKQLVSINQRLLFDMKDESMDSKGDRLLNMLVIMFSKSYNHLTRTKLSELLHVSIPLVSQTLVEAEEWLKLFNVRIDKSNSCGIKICGDEASIRLAIKHVIKEISSFKGLDESLYCVFPRINIEAIKNAIKTTEEDRDLHFADEAFDDCLIYSSIIVQRNSTDNLVVIEDEEMEVLQTYAEYQFAKSILQKVFEPLSIEVKEVEIGFLSIHILCSRMIDTSYISSTKEILEEFNDKLDTFITQLINVVSVVTDISLVNDLELRKGLKIHLKSCLFRFKYMRAPSSKISRVIKEEYPQTFRISWIVSILFEENFNIKISEIELSYIVIYLQSALERNKKNLEVLLVSSNGMGINSLIKNRLKQEFGRIENFTLISLHNFKESMTDDFDLTISPHELNIDNYVKIDELLSKASIAKIEENVNHMTSDDNEIRFDVLCHDLFEPDLIILRSEAKNKEDVIRIMADKLYNKKLVTKNFVDSVLEHEQVNSTAIGNLSATPHGDQVHIYESRVVFLTLKEPILWDEDMVQLVFLLAVKTDNNLEIEKTKLFCQQYINLVDSMDQVNKLLSVNNEVDFFKYIIK